MATKHKCSYCNLVGIGTREQLVDIGWSFADISKPIRKVFKTCPEHFDELKKDISKALDGTMQTKWD